MNRLFILLAAFSLGLSTLSTTCMADDNRGKIVNGILNIGAKALQAEQQRRADKQAARESAAETAATGEISLPAEPPHEASAGAAPEDTDTAPEKRTWRDRGKDMLGAFMGRGAEGMGEVSPGKLLGQAFKEAVDVIVNEYKEQYKQEGREYAREVGDKIVERVRKDPQISSSITSVKILCWVVIAYLTLVTLIMLFSLLHLKKTNRQLLEKLETLAKKP